MSVNPKTGSCQGFGLLEFFHPDDAEYLHRVITASDFRYNGYPMSAVLSKLNKESFHAQYKVNEKSEMPSTEGNKTLEIAGFKFAEPQRTKVTHFVQQPIEIKPPAPVSKDTTQEQLLKYYDDYYKNIFAQLAQMGLYYDRATNTYRPLHEQEGLHSGTERTTHQESKETREEIASSQQPTHSESRNQTKSGASALANEGKGQQTGLDELELPPPPPQHDADQSAPPGPIVHTISAKCEMCSRGFFSSQAYELHKKADSRHKELTRRQLLQQLGLAK